MKRLTLVSICAVVLMGAIICPNVLKNRTGQSSGTIITPDMHQEIGRGRNVIWCSTFQLAWDELKKLSGGPVELAPASSLAETLNKIRVSKKDLDESSYVAAAGFAEDGVVQRIKNELHMKFKGTATPDLLRLAPSSGFVTYAYLSKDLPFKWAFSRFDDRLTFDGKLVQSFGIHQFSKDQENEVKDASQVSILDYKGGKDDEFVIELKTLDKANRLILAKVQPLRTLSETISMVQSRVSKSHPSSMCESTSLSVPVLDLDLTKDYQELLRNIKSRNLRLNGQAVYIARQKIRFRMDERGAVLKSQFMVAGMGGPGMMSTNLVFDRPFLVLIERKNASNPYFAAWIGNAELMKPGRTHKRP